MTLTPLSAPAPWSSQVTFGGQTITPAGNWSGPLDATDVQPSSAGVYPVVLGPDSAAIADVSAAPGTTVTAAIKRHTTAKRHATAKRKTGAKTTRRSASGRRPGKSATRRARAGS
jgi:hypothetical protein